MTQRAGTATSPKLVATALAVATSFLFLSTPARAASPNPQDPTPEQAKYFEQKVRPLLAENCYACHGEKKQKGRLRLDSLAAAAKGGDTGPAVVPGDPAKSLLVKAVGYHDEDLQMPPDEKLVDAQVKVLTDWVKMGAPWPKTPAGGIVAGLAGKKRTIRDQDRQFWSFRPVTDPAPPAAADDAGWARNPVDRFVLAKLRSEGLTPAPEADRVALIRRATFDLHGLPPTPAEVETFLADTSPDAYEKLVDRLLASPRYGERYARHWLDLVRYAESDAYKQDAYRPNAWPYRDYVVKSFNADKPYDVFVREQLAGDELAPNDPDVTVATGYLRAGIYEYNQADVRGQVASILTDVTDVTADAVLGLSMGCARCHDHKFDPILQADYYRLQAFFAPMLQRNDLLLAKPAEIEKYRAALAAWEVKTADVRAEIAKIEQSARDKAIEGAVNKFPLDIRAIIYKPDAERTPAEELIAQLGYRQVNEKLAAVDVKLTGPAKDRYDALKKKLADFDAVKPKPLMTGLVVTDVGPVPPPTEIAGDPQKRTVEPGAPTVLEHLSLKVPEIKPTATSTGRRTALAGWLTDPANPLTTRVIANRVWQWHFGQGLVRTSSDYGTLGDAPTHPELLDYLTTRLVENGWHLKPMHRLVMTSAAYRQLATRPVPEVAKLKDPENKWLWRMATRRLDAEQVRDAMLAVSGELDLRQAGGPSAEYTAPSRTIFTKLVRNTRDPLLGVFDAAESFSSVASRDTTTTASQALMMVNGDWPLKRAAAFAQRVTREASSGDPAAMADRAYRVAYGRPPSADEQAAAVVFLNKSRGPARVELAANAPSAVAAAVGPSVNDQPITQVMPQTGGQAVLMRNANPADMLKMPAGDARLAAGDAFTVEAYVLLESLYDSASVRVIASQWNGDQKKPGWSLGVTSERSAYQPRNLILQLVGDGTDGRKGGYEVIPSNLRLELHKVYYVGVAVNLTDTSERGVTFWLKEVGDMDAPLRTAQARHTVTGPVASASPLIIGGREAGIGQAAHGWDGLIGEVRISSAALRPDQILWNDGDAKGAVVGHWRFEETPGFLKESAGRMPDLVRLAASPKPGKSAKPEPTVNVDAGLIDLCHVLLNSNEFLYVD